MNNPSNHANNEMFYQLVTLLLSVVIVHTLYVSLIRPNAESIIRQQAEVVAAGGPQETSRSFLIIIKDLVYNPLGKIFLSVLKIGRLIFIINLA